MTLARRMALAAGFLGALAGCDAGEAAHTTSSAGSGGSGGASAASTGTTTTTTGPGATGAGGATATTTTTSAGGATSASTTTTTSASTTATTSASTSASTSGGNVTGLHVEGNKLVDNGQTVRLFGVDHSGSEYSCIQNHGFFDWGNSGVPDQAFVSDMLAWHVNAVRVPLNEDCWLAINGAPGQYSGELYQTAISQYVSLLRQNGLYVIVDLHWNAGGGNQSTGQQEMADSDHAPDFWTGVATAFKGDQGVIFDLYNEPHDIAWSCWLNGGCTTSGGWEAAGMQQLLTAVRATGATNVVMAGGLNWSGDLSQWVANKPSDPMNNLAASLHSYNNAFCNAQSCWSVVQTVAADVPVITGELGENDCASGYIDQFMSWADGAGVSYLGWAWNADFNCGSGPALVSNWTGTATSFGAGYQSHLASVNP